jgi:flagellin
MGLSVQTNLAALNAANNLTNTQNQLASSLQKLSSGFRINSAADDAAGLAISEGMRSQMGGITVGIRNAQDGISVVQTAEGALNETTSILQRMRDLSVQGANSGALTTDASANIQKEIEKLKTTLNSIASNTSFNGKTLLNGNYSSDFQVGANVGETVNVAVTTNASSSGLGVDTVDVTTAAQAGWNSAIKVGAVKTAATASTDMTAAAYSGTAITAGAVTINGVSVTLAAASTEAQTIAAINASSAGVTASDSSGKLLLTSNTPGSTTPITVADGTSTGLATQFSGGTATTGAAAVLYTATDAAVISNNALASGADQAILAIDAAINKVSTERANLGATQNQFDHTINNQNVALQNVTASESRIRDTDMAATMVDFTKSQILSQAGVAMLAQAKSLPQDVLKLLQ